MRSARNSSRLFAVGCIALLVALHAAPVVHAREALEEQLPLETQARIEAAFLTGLRLIKSGKPRAAVRIFRRILAKNSDLPRVRLELARAYFVAKSWTESRAEFTAVLSSDVPPGVKKTILKFLNAIDARRGFDWNFSVAFSSSSNAARNYKTDTVDLNFFGTTLPFTIEREKSENFGVTLNTSGEIRRELAGGDAGASIVGFMQVSASAFDAPGVRSDDHSVGSSLGLRFVNPRSVTLFSTRVSARNYAHKRFEDRYGLNGGYEWRSTGARSYFLSASVDRIDNKLSDFKDGTQYQARAGLLQSISGSAAIGGALQVARLNADADFENYTQRGVETVGRADLGFGIGVDVKLSLSRVVYDEIAPFFLKKRSDKRMGIDVEISKNDFFILGNFKPFLKISPSRNISSIDIFTYDEFRFIFGLKNAF